MGTARPGSSGYIYRHGWIPVAGSGAVDKRSKAKQEKEPSAPPNPKFIDRMSQVSVSASTDWTSDGPRVGQKAATLGGTVVTITGITPDGDLEFVAPNGKTVSRPQDEMELLDEPRATAPPTGLANPSASGPPPALSDVERKRASRKFPGAADAGYHISNDAEDLNAGWKPSKKGSDAVKEYTSSSFRDINELLRGRSRDESRADVTRSTIARMDMAFEESPPLKRNIVVSRGLSGNGPFPSAPPPMQPGAEFVDDGYVSTSKRPEGVNTGDVVVEVRVPAGKKAIDVNHATGSTHPGEQEVLLPRGSRFRVVSDGENDYGDRHIVVEVL